LVINYSLKSLQKNTTWFGYQLFPKSLKNTVWYDLPIYTIKIE
jgi:hypothetical protein